MKKKLYLSRRSLDFQSFWYLSLGMPIFAIIHSPSYRIELGLLYSLFKACMLKLPSPLPDTVHYLEGCHGNFSYTVQEFSIYLDMHEEPASHR